MTNETHQERIIRLFTEVARDLKSQDEAGAPGAHLRWALAEGIRQGLLQGYLITDLDCFRHDPRYTGDQPRKELPAEIKRSLQEKGIISGEPRPITQQLIADELKNIIGPSGQKKPFLVEPPPRNCSN